MKLGIVLEKVYVKLDTIDYIKGLMKEFEVVIFTSDLEYMQRTFADVSCVPLKSKTNFTVRFWIWMFRYFGEIPKSINNFKVISFFTSVRIKNSFRRILYQKILLPFIIWSPKFLNYDQFLKKVSKADHTLINPELNDFLFFTQIEADLFLAKLLKEKKNISAYLYSWDHSCKLKKLPKKIQYFVWSDQIKEDLQTLNRIDSKYIKILGSTQFTLIEEYLNLNRSWDKKPFIYFGFSTAYPPLIKQEMDYIISVHKVIIDEKLNLRLRVRTYPNTKGQDIYKPLENLEFVDVEYTDRDRLALKDHTFEKYDTMSQAIAFIHFGTTMGLEACFFDTPSFIIDYYSFIDPNDKGWKIKNFVHQYQNDKYLIEKDFANVVKSHEAMVQILKDLHQYAYPKYLEYNKDVLQAFPMISTEGLIQRTSELLKAKVA